MKAFDKDIRRAITDRILRFNSDDPSLLLVEELELQRGAARIDMAFFGNDMLGVEIKGPRDSLTRLPEQARIYNSVFDRLIIVAAPKFIEKIADVVPIWWGIVEVRDIRNRLLFSSVRKPKENPNVEIESVVELLWKNELIALLERESNVSANPRNPRAKLRHQLLESTNSEEAKALTLEAFKSRENWRQTQLIVAK